jgi:hypothetical protein
VLSDIIFRRHDYLYFLALPVNGFAQQRYLGRVEGKKDRRIEGQKKWEK